MSTTQKIEITNVHFGSSLFVVSYDLNGKPMSASDDHVADSFDKAMAGLISHAIDIKELPDKAGKDYRCNKLGLTYDIKEKGENRKATICLTKVTANGKADNLTTAACHYEAINEKTQVLPQKTKLAIEAVIREAKKFIKGHRDLTELYSQPELATAV